MFICTHNIIRKFCEALSLLAFSVEVFRGYFINFWTILDIFTTIVTVIVITWNLNNTSEYRGGMNALITGLLWMRVLGFLKVLNKQMATFIMSLTEIVLDLRYFFVIILVVVFMFGDMMNVVVTSKDNGEYCQEYYDNGESESETFLRSFCSAQRTPAYLRVYVNTIYVLDIFEVYFALTFLFSFIVGIQCC